MTTKTKFFIAVIVAVVAFAFGRHTSPEKVITKTEIKEVEVVKVVKEQQKSQQNDRQEHVIITKYPDGRIVTEKYILNKDTIFHEKKENSESKKETDIKIVKEIENKKPNYMIGALAESGLDMKPKYGVTLDRRVLGPVWMGAYGKTNKEFGLTVKLEL